MSHLRIVGTVEPTKPACRGRKAPYVNGVLNEEEQRRGRAALRGLRDSFSTWRCLADAMQVPINVLTHAMNGANRLTPALLFAASKASGVSIADMLAGPAAADRCRACGAIKRAS